MFRFWTSNSIGRRTPCNVDGEVLLQEYEMIVVNLGSGDVVAIQASSGVYLSFFRASRAAKPTGGQVPRKWGALQQCDAAA